MLDVETNGYGSFRPATQEVIQVGFILDGDESCFLVKGVSRINPKVPHHINVEQCETQGVTREDACDRVCSALQKCSVVVGHNIRFDLEALNHTFGKQRILDAVVGKDVCCTMLTTVHICKLPGRYRHRYKYPKLIELYRHLFHTDPKETLHDALGDCRVTLACYNKLA